METRAINDTEKKEDTLELLQGEELSQRLNILKEEYMDPANAYSMLSSIKTAFHVGVLGLGANNSISKLTSMTTAATIEGFCSVLEFVTFFNELINVLNARCTGVTQKARGDQPFFGGHSLYLSFRLCCILADFTGAVLVASEIPFDQMQNATQDPSQASTNSGIRSSIGLLLMAVGTFGGRALDARYKPESVSKQDTTKEDRITLTKK